MVLERKLMKMVQVMWDFTWRVVNMDFIIEEIEGG